MSEEYDITGGMKLSKEEDRKAKEKIARSVGSFGRGAIEGAASAPLALWHLPGDIVDIFKGQQRTDRRLEDVALEKFDKLTGGKAVPQTEAEENAHLAGSFIAQGLTGAGLFKAVAKMIAKRVGPAAAKAAAAKAVEQAQKRLKRTQSGKYGPNLGGEYVKKAAEKAGAEAAKKAVEQSYKIKAANAAKNFYKPTIPAAAAVGASQAYLRNNPESPVGALGAGLLAGAATGKVPSVAKGAKNLATGQAHSIPDWIRTSKMQSNKPFMKQVAEELTEQAGAPTLNQFPASNTGNRIYHEVKNYKERTQSGFNNDYRNNESKLKHALKADPDKAIIVDLKKPASILKRDYFKMVSDEEKSHFLKTKVGKEWVRSLGIKDTTNPVDLDALIRTRTARGNRGPQMNMAEAKAFLSNLEDLVKTEPGTVRTNEQRILNSAAKDTRRAISGAIKEAVPELGNERLAIDKRYSDFHKKDVKHINKIMKLEGEPEKIFGEVTKDLGEGANPLRKTTRMAGAHGAGEIGLGVVYDIGKVDNKFDLPTFYRNFRKYSAKEQGRILEALPTESRVPLEKALEAHKSALDIAGHENTLTRAKKFGSHLLPGNKHVKDVVIEDILGSRKAGSGEINRAIGTLERNYAAKMEAPTETGNTIGGGGGQLRSVSKLNRLSTVQPDATSDDELLRLAGFDEPSAQMNEALDSESDEDLLRAAGF